MKIKTTTNAKAQGAEVSNEEERQFKKYLRDWGNHPANIAFYHTIMSTLKVGGVWVTEKGIYKKY